jgi:UDP-N-acetyl-D-glucosamine dehydrogenase
MNSNIIEELISRFTERAATVGVVGMGYVGQPLALRYSEAGYKVLGFDIDGGMVAELNDGRSRIAHVDNIRVATAVSNGFEATTDFSRIAEVDGVIICVPTPLNKHREPNLTYVVDTCDQILPHLRSGQIVSLESTTYPGTTKEVVIPKLEQGDLIVGKTIFAVYSPEREDPANPDFTTQTIPKVLGGYTDNCKRVGLALYGQVIDRLVPLSSTEAAEMTKLLENIHRAVNVGLVNEMKIVADRMGIDIFEVIDAAATKPFGFTPYYPGPGLGGHCIPIDPFYLTWKAREYGINTRFIELAGEVNSSMPDYVFGKLQTALNNLGKSVHGSKVMVLGVSYKKNVDDMRESPSAVLLEKLRDHGAVFSYADPHVPLFPPMREHSFDLSATPLTPETLAATDAVVLATNHDDFDYDMILRHAPLIVDSRGVFRKAADHVVRA